MPINRTQVAVAADVMPPVQHVAHRRVAPPLLPCENPTCCSLARRGDTLCAAHASLRLEEMVRAFDAEVTSGPEEHRRRA